MIELTPVEEKSIIFTLGFSKADGLTYTSNFDYINLFFLIKSYGCDKKLELLADLKEQILKFGPNATYLTSLSPLNEQLLESRGHLELSQDELDLMKVIFCEMHFLTIHLKKIDWINENARNINLSENGLYVRYGVVELRVIENFFRIRDKCVDSVSNVIGRLDDESFIFKSMNQGQCKWISADDYEFNLKALMTNAGFYFSKNLEQAKNDLSYWAHKYLEGLKLGQLFLCPPGYPFFWNVWNILEKDYKGHVEYVNFPDPERFFGMLKGKKVLIVTPFKELCERMVSEKRLQNLYKNFTVDTEFIFIKSPMSIYPSRPSESWSSSFNELVNITAESFVNNKADIFMGSCGCYGIPLATEMYKKFNCPSVYYGNFLHTLLGIRQGCSKDFGDGFINEELRLDSDLSKYQNLSLIDGGRYV